MLARRLQRRPNIEPALLQCLVFFGQGGELCSNLLHSGMILQAPLPHKHPDITEFHLVNH